MKKNSHQHFLMSGHQYNLTVVIMFILKHNRIGTYISLYRILRFIVVLVTIVINLIPLVYVFFKIFILHFFASMNQQRKCFRKKILILRIVYCWLHHIVSIGSPVIINCFLLNISSLKKNTIWQILRDKL